MKGLLRLEAIVFFLSHMKEAGVLAVLLRSVNYGFWSLKVYRTERQELV